MKLQKPLGHKAYGSIAHLPTSRLGKGDHSIHSGQARICCERTRDRHDLVIVTEKLDGCCTAVARIGDQIIALGRAGWPASTSPYEMHHLFDSWVRQRESLFRSLLNDGERLVGEWLAQAHGTRYDLPHEPWVVFDLMREHSRAIMAEVVGRINLTGCDLWHASLMPKPIGHTGAISIASVRQWLDRGNGHGGHGAIDPVEGAVWRVERKGKVDFLAKWVRPDKVDGRYLPEVSGGEAVWNWRPA